MIILSVESSCDETAVALVEDGRKVLTDQIFSQVNLHKIYGGVVPEIASRSHTEVISILAERAIQEAGISRGDIDAVAVTYAPGLIGALLVGVNFAKSVAMSLNVPLIPVHHIRGHIAANYLAFPELEPPFLALAVSGGNSMIVDAVKVQHPASGSTDGVDGIKADTNAPAEYFTTDGVRLSGKPLQHGVYMQRKGGATRKVAL